ncbi:MAG: TVP38/TMEM64 family protein [Phycisphaerales bacterium]|nr:TVP38/TMEM64 family protein [Phycisphaerales bacterium]
MNDQTTEPDPIEPSDAPRTGDEPADDALTIVKNLGAAGVFGVLTIILPLIGIGFMIAFMKKIQPWIESLGTAGAVVFSLMMMGLAGFAIMPTQALSIVVGIFFGATIGIPAASTVAVSGAVGAAIIAYGWVWIVAEKKVMEQIEVHPKARIVHHALVDRGFVGTLGVITLLRFPPNLPFALSNFVMASMRVNFPAYVLGTLVGMAPRLVICVWIGTMLGSLDQARENPYRFWFLAVTIVFAIAIFMVLSRWAKAALAKYEAAE